MRTLHFLRDALTLVVVMMTMMVDVKSFTDAELVVNCSSTTYPDVSCSTPPNTVTLDLSHNNMKAVSEHVHYSTEITEALSSVQSNYFCRPTGISKQPGFRVS